MKPKVSVIIPTYNRAHTLKRAMNSVLQQEDVNLELIVVDDGSTDNTKELVESYSDTRVRYLSCSQNNGPSKARNLGAATAQGVYIAFQDSDDEWSLQKLKKQLQVFDTAQGNIGMVYCSFVKRYSDREVTYPPVDVPRQYKSGRIFDTLLFRPLVGTPTMLIPRKVWDEMQGFQEELRCFEDWELTMRIAEKYSIAFVDEPLVTVYESTNSLIVDSTKAIEADFYMFREFYEYYKKDEMKKEKLDRIASRVRCEKDFEAYRQGMQQTLGVQM